MKNLQKGFTLIELLVVIAIIGILSSIVLASLSSARTKGQDAAIQSTLSNMRAQAELYYSNNNNYGTNAAAYSSACPAAAVAVATGGLMGVSGNGGLLELNTGLVSQAGAAANTLCTVSALGGAWAVSAILRSPSTVTTYCVDSTGQAKTRVGTLATSICQ